MGVFDPPSTRGGPGNPLGKRCHFANNNNKNRNKNKRHLERQIQISIVTELLLSSTASRSRTDHSRSPIAKPARSQDCEDVTLSGNPHAVVANLIRAANERECGAKSVCVSDVFSWSVVE